MTTDPIRTRLGVILPADNAVLEPELASLGLPGLGVHVVRLTTTDRPAMPEQGIAFSDAFTELGVDAVGYACAETSLLGGVDTNEHIVREVTSRTGLPTVTAIGAMVESCRALDADRVAVVAPYRESSAVALRDYLTAAGLDVVDLCHRDFSVGSPDPREWFATNRQPAQVAANLARSVDHASAEAIVISATNLWTFPVLHALEQELDRPVISTNSALLWAMLQRADDPRPELVRGRLAPAHAGQEVPS